MNDLCAITVVSHREQKFPTSSLKIRFDNREFPTSNIFSNKFLEDYYTIFSRNSDGFYKHQIISFHLATEQDLLLSVGTGGGKTVAVFLPILDKILNTTLGGIKAIFVYPTKALMQDQMRQMEGILRRSSLIDRIKISTYSADEKEDYRNIFNATDIVITNPDALHFLLLKKDRWSGSVVDKIRRTAFVVFDELHLYKGYMLQNLFYLIAKLKILTPREKVVIHALSATLPEEPYNQIFPVRIEGDADCPKIDLIFKRATSSEIKDYVAFTKEIINQHPGKSAVVFFNSVVDIERYAHEFEDAAVYHGRLFADERKVELDRFLSGKAYLLLASPAAEAGVDFDAEIVITQQTTTDSLLQRIGRTGRRDKDCLAAIWVQGIDVFRKIKEIKPLNNQLITRREIISVIRSAFGDFDPHYYKAEYPRRIQALGMYITTGSSDYIMKFYQQLGLTVDEDQDWLEQFKNMPDVFVKEHGFRQGFPSIKLQYQQQELSEDCHWVVSYIDMPHFHITFEQERYPALFLNRHPRSFIDWLGCGITVEEAYSFSQSVCLKIDYGYLSHGIVTVKFKNKIGNWVRFNRWGLVGTPNRDQAANLLNYLKGKSNGYNLGDDILFNEAKMLSSNQRLIIGIDRGHGVSEYLYTKLLDEFNKST